MKEKCKTCYWWIDGMGYPAKPPIRREDVSIWDCRVKAPTKRQGDYMATWPRTHGFDGCGQHKLFNEGGLSDSGVGS